jgi:hypothetical protein
VTAEVIELFPGLKHLPPDPDCPRERVKDAAMEAWLAVSSVFIGSPIKIVRQKTIERHERTAFELGVEYGRRDYTH